ncbi:SRPBCC family protein [Staphylococcus pseudoxylosus]|uniref:SRPBCC family protein n=1 Tax=Staphylococcus pseudoxylosus TaxID=2282419 RepID=UPI002DBDDD27|nr:SRPBCC family protein [Staphylococcus pseudoxylosus]MEB6046056.1 SRPBCC family protein [Staphylococcus pseudoxylosus]
MANTKVSIEIVASPDEVWKKIGGFDSLPDWLPYILSSKISEGGRVRTLTNPDGSIIIERLEVFSHDEKFYSYSIIQAPFPVTYYLSTIKVRESEKGSIVEWSGEFSPENVSEKEAINIFYDIYKEGLEALQNQF